MKEIICVEGEDGGLFRKDPYDPVQEITRCKNCKMRDKNIWEQHRDYAITRCRLFNIFIRDDFFCADGRKMNPEKGEEL